MKKKSIVFKIIITLIALFAIYNVYWLIFSYIRWKPLCDAVGYDERYEDYVKFVGEIGGTITLNEHMEFYGEPTEEEKELFEKYKPEIEHTFDKMREVWNLE